jgi:hypothetical protein
MTLDQKLKRKQYGQIWQEYCGFLDFSMVEFMEIQNRLLLEQIELYSNCELGRRILNGKKPRTVDEFRQMVPLTQYEDYADLLLPKVESALPAKPALWIETTWEGSKNPIKRAPYTESMVRSYRNNIITCVILATSKKKGQFTLRGGENCLYGMAPLPYLTGLIPYVIADEMYVNFLPPTQEAEAMSFGQRNKIGFSMGIQKGIDLFFGLSSVIVKIGEEFASGGASGRGVDLLKNSPLMNYRLIKAWIKSKRGKTPILPKDIWKLKGLICAGTDTVTLKRKIEHDWGVKPLEVFGGTEPACIATETWSKKGLVLFPDVCFYEFIPKSELELNMEDPTYMPNTCLLDEVVAGNEYEMIISNFKGGAFARYRVGDMFQCISLGNEEDGICLPYFRYIDRDPRIIDIAGFTRISENTISEAIALSTLNISQWFAVKEIHVSRQSFLHLYIEMDFQEEGSALTEKRVKERLSICFRDIDSDYKDLESLLGIEPMEVSILPTGTISHFGDTFKRSLRRMNPSATDVSEVLKFASDE